MSDELKQFYRYLQDWLDAGCPSHDIFDKSYGLCSNAAFFGHTPIEEEQAQMFVAADLHGEYPFNDGSYESYRRESRSKTLFNNPARLAWIKEHAQ